MSKNLIVLDEKKDSRKGISFNAREQYLIDRLLNFQIDSRRSNIILGVPMALQSGEYNRNRSSYDRN